jgi:glycosyltransferase involved in cell wall biosynthesis
MAALDFVAPLSLKDARLLASLSPVVPQRVIEPCYSVCEKAPRERDVRQRSSVVFVGAMNRSENVDAVRFAIREILPRVRRRIPDARLWVVGARSDSPKLSRAVGDPNVIFTGFVEDLAGFLSSMQVALLPLRLGAGIKVKVLECMSAGVAVVTTEVGSEGIQGRHSEHFMVGESADELAEHVVLLLNSEGTRTKMAVKAREMLDTSHNFSASVEEFSKFVVEIVRVKKGPPALGLVVSAKS